MKYTSHYARLVGCFCVVLVLGTVPRRHRRGERGRVVCLHLNPPCTARSSSIANATDCTLFCASNCGTAAGATYTCTGGNGSGGSSDCIGGGSLVYSCRAEAVVAARDLAVGVRIRAASTAGDVVLFGCVLRLPPPVSVRGGRG